MCVFIHLLIAGCVPHPVWTLERLLWAEAEAGRGQGVAHSRATTSTCQSQREAEAGGTGAKTWTGENQSRIFPTFCKTRLPLLVTLLKNGGSKQCHVISNLLVSECFAQKWQVTEWTILVIQFPFPPPLDERVLLLQLRSLWCTLLCHVGCPECFIFACLQERERDKYNVLKALKESFKTSRFPFFVAVFSNRHWPHPSGYHLWWIHQSTLFCYELLHSISYSFLRLSITILPPEPDLILSTTKCQTPARGAPVGEMLEAVSHLADCRHSARGVWVDTASFPPCYPPPLSHPGTLALPPSLPSFSPMFCFILLCASCYHRSAITLGHNGTSANVREQLCKCSVTAPLIARGDTSARHAVSLRSAITWPLTWPPQPPRFISPDTRRRVKLGWWVRGGVRVKGCPCCTLSRAWWVGGFFCTVYVHWDKFGRHETWGWK